MTVLSGRFTHGWTPGPAWRVAVGMARRGFDLQLTRYDERGWRVTFYITGMEHSPTSARGTGWDRTTATATSPCRYGHAARRGGDRKSRRRTGAAYRPQGVSKLVPFGAEVGGGAIDGLQEHE